MVFRPQLGPAFVEAAARDLYNVVHPRTWAIDAFILSFQKCGRTWLELMLAQAFAEQYGLSQERWSRDLTRMSEAAGRGPRIFSTHDWSETTGELSDPVSPYLMLAWPLRTRFWGRRVLMLIRDPRDVMVSSYYQVTRRSLRPLPFDSIDDYVLDPLYGFPRLVAFLRQWNINRHMTGAFKLVRYEQLRAEGPATLLEVCEFLGLEGVSPPSASKIYAATTMEQVRLWENAGAADLYKFDTPDGGKARRGVIGGYRDELRPQTIAQLDAWMSRLPEAFAYPV